MWSSISLSVLSRASFNPGISSISILTIPDCPFTEITASALLTLVQVPPELTTQSPTANELLNLVPELDTI